MVATMRRLLAALLLLTAIGSAEAQTYGSSTVETTPASLTVSGSAFTPSCPLLGGVSGVFNVVATAASQNIAMPVSCPSSSVGLFVTFNICNGKSSAGTAPCNGTASGPFVPALSFGTGFEFPGSVSYAVSSTNGNNVSGAKDIVTCEVMGTAGPWSCGSPQYAVAAPPSVSLIAQTNCTGTSGAGCTTGAINTTGANLFIITMTNPSNTPGLTDTGSNTYTEAVFNTSGFTPVCSIYYKLNPTTGSSQTFSTSTVITNIGVLAFFIPSPALDLTAATDSGGASVSTIQPGSITATLNEIIVSVGGANNGNVTVNTPLTAGSQNYALSTNNNYAALNAYLFPTTATSYNPTFTETSSATTMCAASATFK